jgi:hypothetical protein
LVVRRESFVSLSVRGDKYTSFLSDVEREYTDQTKLEIVISFPDRMSSRRPAHLFSFSHSHTTAMSRSKASSAPFASKGMFDVLGVEDEDNFEEEEEEEQVVEEYVLPPVHTITLLAQISAC